VQANWRSNVLIVTAFGIMKLMKFVAVTSEDAGKLFLIKRE
jgi:hypothetical protein